MNRWLVIFLMATASCAEVSRTEKSTEEERVLCSHAWSQFIEENVRTGDGQAHGPDIGSDEWKSVVEFKLGIRDKPNVPNRDSEAWCRHIDQIVQSRFTSSAKNNDFDQVSNSTGPSFSCDSVPDDNVEAMICGDTELSALDRKFSGVYAAASKKATNEHPSVLKAEERGWIKGRNDCWKSNDKRGCVRDGYRRRIAELQAQYRLVPSNEPVRFVCDGNLANEVVATFFQTDPSTLIAERGDSISLMFVQPSGSGAKYQGRNETFWEHHGEASITWGYDAPEMHCKKAS
ncbi:MliC family protein [Candidatus Nitrospira salsa]